MQAIDAQGALGKFILDESRKIPKAHLNSVCKIHQGQSCCRYIGLGANGFVCVKHTAMKAALDQLVSQQKLVAKGDNCEGLGELPVDLDTQKKPNAP